MKDGGFAAGEVVDGRYRVEGPLGAGGMATVVRAHDLGRDVPVAIKVMAADCGFEPDSIMRFEREAQLAALVDREEGVVRVWSAGRHRGRMFIAMELVVGEDLSRVLERGLAPEAVAALVAAVARTIARCHARGVVHRDLKPANILVRAEDGRPLVADFGVALATQSRRLTRTGDLVGTPSYMAPELVVDSARSTDPRADVYSLGAILYEGLTGRPPFAGPVLEVLRRVVEEEPPAPSALRRGVPPALDAICGRAMSKEVAQRYTAEELALDLERFGRGESVAAPPPGRQGLPPVLGSWAAIAALLFLIGVTAALGGGSRERVARARLAEAEALLAPALDGWALGLGSGAAPAKEEVVLRAEALADVRQALPEDEGPRADEALGWLHAVARALDRSTASSRLGPADVVVDALLDEGPPLDRLRRLSLAREDAPVALRVEARLWRLALAGAARLAPVADYARARARLAVVAGAEDDVRDADASFDALLEREPRALVHDALRPGPMADLATFIGRLEALPPPCRVDPSAPARRTLAFDEDEALWADVLRAPGAQPERPLLLVQLLGAALRAPPGAAAGPALRRTLDAVTDELALEGEARGDDVSLRRALAFDTARVRFVGGDPPTPGLTELVTWKLLREGADRVELVLAGLRCGFTPNNTERAFTDRAEAMLADRPWSRAAAYLHLRVVIERQRLVKPSLEATERRAALARAVVRAGLVDDLAPHYLADAHEELARSLVERVEVALGSGRAPNAAEVLADAACAVAHARESLALEPDDGGNFRDSWLTLGRAVQLLHPGVGDAMHAGGLRTVDGWLARSDENEHARERWAAARAMLLHHHAGAAFLAGKHEAAVELARDARMSTMRVEVIVDSIAIEGRALLSLGRAEEANALVVDRLQDGLGDEGFAEVAIDAAIVLGRPDEARKRLEGAVEADPNNAARLRKRARDQGLE